ncbi:MAG TPA: hypothetical protein PK680_03225 [Novosphingobium sp.]|nr:hypothetical protein [Novosphingobium sp.]HQA17377.1 hypothetical protein [Novosphingobium sp.]
MSDHKPVASLSPKLLARKGGARPAMRHMASALAAETLQIDGDDHADDLGWNDMGHDHEAAVVAIHGDLVVPEVVRQQRKLADRVSADRRSALGDGRRAAFTLRVDAERHLKLRLACAIEGRSAQSLVTEALDRLLADVPAVSDLAAHVAKTKHN